MSTGSLSKCCIPAHSCVISLVLPQVEQSVRLPQYTYMRAFELRINTTIIGIQLLAPLPSKPAVWRLMATANGQPVGSTLT